MRVTTSAVRVRGSISGLMKAMLPSSFSFVLGKRAIVDVQTAVIAVVALLAMTKIKKAPEPLIIVAAGVVGLLLRQ